MKTIKYILITFMILVSTITIAQSHNTTTGSACKYAINRCTNMEGCPQCDACTLEDKKEKEAKLEEEKRQNDKILADANAKKEAEQKAYQDQLDADNAEAKRKSDSGNVLINAQNSNNLETNISVEKKSESIILLSKNDNTKSKLSAIEETSKDDALRTTTILNEKNELIFTSNSIIANNWDPQFLKEDIPSNLIVIQELIQEKRNADYYNMMGYGFFNLMNSKGEKILDEKEINFLTYCGNGIFIYTFFEDNYPIDQKKTEHFNSVGACGSKMIVFDYYKNTKTVFNPNNKFGENNFYCISNIIISTTENILCEFKHYVRTEKLGGYYEVYSINVNGETLKMD